jgi:hypothetical protein
MTSAEAILAELQWIPASISVVILTFSADQGHTFDGWVSGLHDEVGVRVGVDVGLPHHEVIAISVSQAGQLDLTTNYFVTVRIYLEP